MVKVKRALISVSDKKGIVGFAKGLKRLGVEIISTGGTAVLLKDKGIEVRAISDVTGFPEILSGRVKTLHPKIHGGILAKRAELKHLKQIKRYKIPLIDLVVVNLYPFAKTILDPKVKLEDALEMIDIGGPAMLRSAAKNFKDVACVSDPDRYPKILAELEKNNGLLSDETCASLSVEAFGHTAQYDSMIYEFLRGRLCRPYPALARKSGAGVQRRDLLGADKFPDILHLAFKKLQGLRYGENPHQEAAFYSDLVSPPYGLARMRKLHGKELSFNNILDLNAALQVVKDFSSPCACIIKHNSPCGVALSDKLYKAYKYAFECDSESAFGGIMGLNRKVDLKAANEIYASGFLECIIAPGYEGSAIKILKGRKNLRIMQVMSLPQEIDKGVHSFDLKKVEGGLLIQEPDTFPITRDDLKIVTKRKPTEDEIKSLLFAWLVAKHVKSNAIVIAKDEHTIGIGGGNPSRVDSVEIAIKKAGKNVKGACLASDGFFPKSDSIRLAAKARITAIIQPGGSIRDKEVIRAANRANIAMVFTGIRHFKH